MIDKVMNLVKNVFLPGFLISFIGLSMIALMNKQLNMGAIKNILIQSLWYAAYGTLGNIVQGFLGRFVGNAGGIPYLSTAVRSMLFFLTIIIAKQLVNKKIDLKAGLSETINSFLGCAGDIVSFSRESFANKYLTKELAALSEFE